MIFTLSLGFEFSWWKIRNKLCEDIQNKDVPEHFAYLGFLNISIIAIHHWTNFHFSIPFHVTLVTRMMELLDTETRTTASIERFMNKYLNNLTLLSKTKTFENLRKKQQVAELERRRRTIYYYCEFSRLENYMQVFIQIFLLCLPVERTLPWDGQPTFRTLEAVALGYSNQHNVLNIWERAFSLRMIPIQQAVLIAR